MTTFFTDRPTAEAWSRAHPSIVGEILNTTDAERLGQTIFGALLQG